MNIEETIKNLQAEIETLKKQVHYLNARNEMIAVAKLSNNKYPYYDWVFLRGISEKHSRQIRYILIILEYTLNDRITDITNNNMELPEKVLELLSNTSRPAFEKFREIIYSLLNFDISKVATEDELNKIRKTRLQAENINGKSKFDEYVYELLDSLNKQGICTKICTHLINDYKNS